MATEAAQTQPSPTLRDPEALTKRQLKWSIGIGVAGGVLLAAASAVLRRQREEEIARRIGFVRGLAAGPPFGAWPAPMVATTPDERWRQRFIETYAERLAAVEAQVASAHRPTVVPTSDHDERRRALYELLT